MIAHARQRGFSLLEVLMASVLLALLLTGAWAGVRTATRSAERGEALVERTNTLRVAQEFLRRQISQALVLAYGQERGTGERVVFEGDRDTLTYVSAMPGYLGRGGAYVQRLTIERGRHGGQLVFRHALLNGFDEDSFRDDDENAPPVVLLEHIRQASFEFRALDDRGELGNWQDQWDETAQLPLLVRIEIEFERDANMNWPELVIPVMLDPTSASSPLEPSFFTGG
jgi:general secretion pathway protein J